MTTSKCSISDYGHWNIEAIGFDFNPDDFFGFIYEIIEIDTEKIYIGKKQFRFKINSKIKPSDWKFYTSSSKVVKELILQRGKDKFQFNIIMLCVGKSQLSFEEERSQMINDVLRARLPNGDKKYFNKTIGHRLFTGLEKQTEEQKRKISEGNTGKVRTYEHKQNYSKAKKGIPKSKEHKHKLSKVNIGKKYSKETNSKKGKSSTGKPILWWNNGTEQIRSISCPDGWIRGRLPLNKIWITDGINSKMIDINDEIPERWYKGRVKFTRDTG